MLFGLYLGQRLGDLAKLTWRAVNLETGEIAFATRKTGRRVAWPLVQPREHRSRYSLQRRRDGHQTRRQQVFGAGDSSGAWPPSLVARGAEVRETQQLSKQMAAEGTSMPTRTKYLLDPEYAQRYQSAFGVPPERPFFELFIPEQFRKKELLQAVQGPIWRLERDVIWPQMANLLQRDGVSGDLVEFGVYGGGSFRRLIEIFRPLSVINRYYGFDSFLGLPKPEMERDHPYFWNEGLFADTSKERVLRYLAEGLGGLDQIELVEGWFSNTLPAMRDRISRIAFVRVDCDLYSSTRDVFTFLSDRLVDGAIIYFDDWTHEATTGESCAFFEFAECHANRFNFEHLLTVSDGALAVRVKTKI